MIRFRDFIKLDLEQIAALNVRPKDDVLKHQEMSTSLESSSDFEMKDEQKSKRCQ